jgi:hypothetical protein
VDLAPQSSGGEPKRSPEMAKKKSDSLVEIDGSKPSIEEFFQSSGGTRCGACAQPPEIRALIDEGLNKGFGSVRVTRFLKEAHGIEISEAKVAHHKSSGHHLAKDADAA